MRAEGADGKAENSGGRRKGLEHKEGSECWVFVQGRERGRREVGEGWPSPGMRLTCLLVVLGVLGWLGIGDALEPAELSLHQERCGAWEGIGGGRDTPNQGSGFPQSPQTAIWDSHTHPKLRFPQTPQTRDLGFPASTIPSHSSVPRPQQSGRRI